MKKTAAWCQPPHRRWEDRLDVHSPHLISGFSPLSRRTVFGCSWRPYVEIFSTTRSRCQGRGARRVTACHSQCLRTGPRPAYLSAHPPSPPTMAPGMIRMTRIQSFRGRSHNPPPPLFFSPALFVSLFLDCVIGNLPHPPISLVHAHYLLLLSII